jgi:hypothetical protein
MLKYILDISGCSSPLLEFMLIFTFFFDFNSLVTLMIEMIKLPINDDESILHRYYFCRICIFV